MTFIPKCCHGNIRSALNASCRRKQHMGRHTQKQLKSFLCSLSRKLPTTLTYCTDAKLFGYQGSKLKKGNKEKKQKNKIKNKKNLPSHSCINCNQLSHKLIWAFYWKSMVWYCWSHCFRGTLPADKCQVSYNFFMLQHASLIYWLKVHLSALSMCERDHDCIQSKWDTFDAWLLLILGLQLLMVTYNQTIPPPTST